MMFQKILLATDGSTHAEEALKYAWNLALCDDAQLIVVHAAPPCPAIWENHGGNNSSRITSPRESR